MSMDDFVPGRPMAQVSDCVVVASRTAPCELVDLEAKQHLCTPIAANGQGLGQKNFDPAFAGEEGLADAFKTKHQFFESRESLLEAANDEAKEAFNKVYYRIKNDIETKYKVAFREDVIPEETLNRFVEVNPEYKEALRKLRDEVMSDDIAEALERCLVKHRNDDVARTILRNQVNGKYGWEDNQVITRSALPTGELYRSDFRKDAVSVSSKDIIGHGAKIRQPEPKSAPKRKGIGHMISKFLESPAGKRTVKISFAAAVVGALGYVGYKIGWLDPTFEKEKELGSLSKIA